MCNGAAVGGGRIERRTRQNDVEAVQQGEMGGECSGSLMHVICHSTPCQIVRGLSNLARERMKQRGKERVREGERGCTLREHKPRGNCKLFAQLFWGKQRGIKRACLPP